MTLKHLKMKRHSSTGGSSCLNPFETDADFEMNFAVEMPEKAVGFLPDSDLASLLLQKKVKYVNIFEKYLVFP